MPMLPFLPWMTINEPIHFGRFHLIPTGVALTNGEVPAEQHAPIRTILEVYDHRRRVDQDPVPLLRRDDLSLTSDLTDDQITEYFDFRTRLTFAVLSARQFFEHRYANSDHVRLVIQGFTPERAGGAVLVQRRRDGSTRIIVPRGHLSVRRPHHISGSCQLPRDLDADLLCALESASAAEPPWWLRIMEAIRLFVGANTDTPDVSEHAELIDVVSAFSLLANAWDENSTVQGFVSTLPSSERLPGMETLPDGPKAHNSRFQQALEKETVTRAIWLKDAYRLRGNFSHGRVTTVSYPAIWSEREHLLLAAVAFPLYLKAILEREGFYQMTNEDVLMNTAFDALALLAPFDTEEEEHGSPWSEIISQVRLHRWVEGVADSLWPPGLGESGDHAE